MANAMTVVPYDPSLAGAFHRLWVTWLRETMGKQPQAEDLDAVDHPEAFYLSRGGAVYFALRGSQPVGVVAVRQLGPGRYEFCKLVVADDARGSSAGRALVEACIAFARSRGADALYLQSFHALQTALGMYRRMGFEDCPPPEGMSVLARTQVIMKLALD